MAKRAEYAYISISGNLFVQKSINILAKRLTKTPKKVAIFNRPEKNVPIYTVFQYNIPVALCVANMAVYGSLFIHGSLPDPFTSCCA